MTHSIALLWRGSPQSADPIPEAESRAQEVLGGIIHALTNRGVRAEPIVYLDEQAEQVKTRLLTFDGVLVWVDPISFDQDRTKVDAMLRSVAASGVFVSTHPDVILKMGTKEVIYRTKELDWGTDTHLYRTLADFRDQFPQRLRAAGPRVLKQFRGNGGNGVWKVELLPAPGVESRVRVLHAKRGSDIEDLPLAEFMGRCEIYFRGDGRIIDQEFQARLPEGMIRCYLSHDEVVGFGHQLIKALVPPPPLSAGPEARQPGPRIMSPASNPQFRELRNQMEKEWVPGLMRILGIERTSLPVLWDADFLYGPKTPAGEDSYVLCEINVSCVSPFPESAVDTIARSAAERVSKHSGT
jgi:hypothetical protein